MLSVTLRPADAENVFRIHQHCVPQVIKMIQDLETKIT